MHSEHEKSAFSQRLQVAIKLAGLANLSNAHLANRFNLRHPNQPVSTQAFNHWLIGLIKLKLWQNGSTPILIGCAMVGFLMNLAY